MKHRVLILVVLVIGIHRLPAPIQELEESPTPKPEESTIPTPEQNEGRTKKKASRETTPSTSEVRATLTALVNKLVEAATSTRDMSVLQSILADDFAVVEPDGTVMNKNSYIEFIKSISFDFARIENIEVRVTGPTTAMVVGNEHEKGTKRGGEKFSGAYRFGSKWMKRDGRWRCVGARFISLP